ncbi:hypothetical protein JD844_008719 [Phrynosoma platyrhinos]|uniref:NACHT domain-containing protein n=1 Tax=Phrynosoma platyrhinos TaxID=52577 RepID=A0ABQ7TE76_PHRPL|nr:hypothetical protein JD844_008719 [Phrynosoma platyrhinos]
MAKSTEENSADGPSSDITELDISYLKASYPHVNFDFDMLAKEMEEEYQQIRKELQRGLNASMRSEVKRLKTFQSQPPGNSASAWAPSEMAAAGFYHTGIKTAIQCFCCGLVLLARSIKWSPYAEHKKYWPQCRFLLGKEVGNISKYEIRVQNPRKSYSEVGKSYRELESRLQSFAGWPSYARETPPVLLAKAGFFFRGDLELAINIYEDEDIRLDTFKTWPEEAQVDATSLAKAGFFYTGKKDIVQCFSCAGCLNDWKENDDPWEEHAKAFPHCLQQNMAFEELEWLQEQLRRTYSDIHFRKMFPFGDSAHFAIDLKMLFGDLAIVSKNISNLPLQQLTLPEVLESFQSITVVEGEAGSGKTALLRKIAILWASGYCPILSRYKLVFYLSLNYQDRDQNLVDLICNQVVDLRRLLTKESLENLCQNLTNEVLFLLDDYDEINSVPYDIEDLIQKNYLKKHCLVIAVRTNRVRRIRQYANTILSITEFPVTSTLFLLRKLFSHNIALLEEFYIQLRVEETMHSMFKTPLFVVALGTYWTQYPNGNMFLGLVILKSYMLYTTLKYPQESDRIKSVVSACGELALQGLFKSLFEFSEEDLSEVGVNGDDALHFGLLSKFTAQRLWPIYRFIHLSFQEFLAGLRMSEFLSSDVQADVDKGLQYLLQINTFVKISGRYQYILRYACGEASKAVPKIISHLLHLPSCEKSFESQIENDVYLQQTPKLQLMQQQLLSAALTLVPESYLSKFTDVVLELATELAYQSNMVPACAPMILQFITGKEFPLARFASKDGAISHFFLDYPDSLFLPSRFKEYLTGKERNTDLSLAEICYSSLGTPVVDQEYASAFRPFSEVSKQIKEDEDAVNSIRTFIPRRLPDSVIGPFLHKKGQEKIPNLKFSVSYINSFQAHDLKNLDVLFSVFDHIDLRLNNCKSLLESIKPAVEQNLENFKACSIHNTDLSLIEENLLLSISSLESLEIMGKASIPGTIACHLLLPSLPFGAIY